MSTVSSNSVSSLRKPASFQARVSAFFSSVWASFERQSELQVMLASGYPLSAAQKARIARVRAADRNA